MIKMHVLKMLGMKLRALSSLSDLRPLNRRVSAFFLLLLLRVCDRYQLQLNTGPCIKLLNGSAAIATAIFILQHS